MGLEIGNIATSDGWRGILAEQVTGPLIREIAAKLASYLGKVGFVIGYDTRFMSDYFAEQMAEVLLYQGCNCIISSGPLATPVLAWSVKNMNEIRDDVEFWGIQVTASHNPAHYSGVKIREPSGKAAEAALLDRIIASKSPIPADITGALERRDLITPYVSAMSHVFSTISIPGNFNRIAVDAMHGAAAGLCQKILGPETEVMTLRQNHDPYFGGMPPEPKENSLAPLHKEIQRQAGCMIGIAHDGDGDRLAAWVPKRGYLSPHDIGSILSLDALKRGLPGALVGSVTTTRRVRLLARHFGREYFETDVGFQYAAKVMVETPTVIAVEENGGIAFGEHLPDRDGTYSGLCLVRALAAYQGQVEEMLSSIEAITGPAYFERRDIRDKPSQTGLLEQLKELLPSIFGSELVECRDLLSGFKCFMHDDNWIAIRRAGTEPLFRLYGESQSRRKTEEILNKLETGLDTVS